MPEMTTADFQQNVIPDRPISTRRCRARVTAAVAVTLVFSVLLTFGTLWVAGYRPYRETVALVLEHTPENRAALDKLKFYMTAVKNNYLDVFTDAELIEKLAEGLPATLGNPYTYYLTPEAFQKHTAALSGEYSGIGVVVHFTEAGDVVVNEVLDGSPAAAMGLAAGDLITHVDGVEVTSFADQEALGNAVRGPIGTPVVITIYHPADQTSREIEVVRAAITNASLRYHMLEEGIGYINVKEFSNGLAGEFITAIKRLQAEGAVHFVLDLRFNLGGSADEVIRMLDFLLPAGRIAEVRGRSDGKDTLFTWDSDSYMGVAEQTRYAILVNRYSASASELFAGCLREYEKAVLIGEQTFGKGTGTTTYVYEDGSAVNLAFFQYYLPVSGICIEGEGLAPDRELQLPEEYRYLAVNQIPPGEDIQLSEALGILRDKRE